jgi:hypothetical protein
METPFNNFDKMDEGLKYLLEENEKYNKTAFLNALDSYGNPNSFNLDKLVLDKSDKSDKSYQLKQSELIQLDDSEEHNKSKPKKVKKEKKKKEQNNYA